MNRKFIKYPGKAVTASDANNSDVFIYDGTRRVPKKVEHVKIADGVTEIPDACFIRCRNLTQVEIPESVINIGNHAFAECSRLINVTFPKNLQKIDNYAFLAAKSLKSITIPGTVTHMGYSVFSDCSNLTHVTIEEGVSEIRGFAYTGIQRVNLPKSLTTIHDGCFYKCTKLSSIVIPQNVNYIGQEAFSSCTSLRFCKFEGNNLEKIAREAFYATGLREFSIPYGVSSVSTHAFSWSKNLSEITIPDTVEIIESMAFTNLPNLSSIIIPDSVKKVGEDAFYNCSNLTHVEVGENTVIDGAFNNTPLDDREASEDATKNSLDETSYAEMRTAVMSGEVDGILAYDSQYVDHIDVEYANAVESLTSEYSKLELEASVEAGQGMIEFSYRGSHGKKIRGSWDFENECDQIEEAVKESETLKEFQDALQGIIRWNIELASS